MKLLITGGSGYVGSALLSHLCAGSHPFEILTLGRQRCVVPSGRVPVLQRTCDLRNLGAYDEELLAANCVIWVAALRDHNASWPEALAHNVVPLQHAAKILGQSPHLRRFIYVSSISAADNFAGVGPIDDQSRSAPLTSYGRSKLAAEQLLDASVLPVQIVRLPFVYGPGFRRTSHLAFWRLLALTPWLRNAALPGRLSLIHRHDVARLLEAMILSEAVVPRGPCVVSDGHVYEVNRILDVVCQLFGKRRMKSERCGNWLLRFLAAGSRPEVRYWQHAITSPHFFTVKPSRAMIPEGFAFVDLAAGLSDSYFPSRA